jgi:hypothetical protein
VPSKLKSKGVRSKPSSKIVKKHISGSKLTVNNQNSEHYNIIFKDEQLTDDYTEYFSSRRSLDRNSDDTKLFDTEGNLCLHTTGNNINEVNTEQSNDPKENTSSQFKEKSVKLTIKCEKKSKNKSPKKRKNRLLFHCVNTRYPLIKEIGKAMDWKLTTADNDEWDVMWTDL